MARPKCVYVSIQKIQKVMNLSIQRVRQTSLRCEVALEPRRIMERVLIYFVIVVSVFSIFSFDRSFAKWLNEDGGLGGMISAPLRTWMREARSSTIDG